MRSRPARPSTSRRPAHALAGRRTWARAGRRVALALALAACADAPSSPQGQPGPPPAPPLAPLPLQGVTRIAFVSTRDGAPTIYVADSAGANLVRLAPGERPAWSPDGRRLAFHRVVVGDSLASGLYVMDADGSGVTRLARGWYPAWSPDGSRIAFHTDIGVDSGGIHVVNADGSGLTRLLRHAYAAFPPMEQHCVCQVTWSPDGRRLAFIRGNYEEGSWIHVMNADGSSPGMLPLASPGDGVPTQADPAWSPDGSRIAFASADGRTITSADLKGELRTHVRMGFVERPGWSRDGRHLVFTRGDGPPVFERRIWVASVETGAVRQLIPEAVGPAQRTYSDYDPAWW